MPSEPPVSAAQPDKKIGIAQIDQSQLIKLVRDVLEGQGAVYFPSAVIEELEVSNLLTVSDRISLTRDRLWHTVGGTGEPAFKNSWVPYGGAVLQQPQFFRDQFGFVHMRGIMKTGTVGTAAFTLPPGYRPPLDEIFIVASNDVYGRLYVASTGDVSPASPSNNTYVTLSGVTFKTS